MYFNSLQTLRGLFALIIFFHHFSFEDGKGGMFGAGGDCGVAFFFILSGFVLSQGYMKKETVRKGKESLSIFVIKRLSKIYPLHIVCLLFSILLKLSLSLPDLSNMFLLQAWIPLKEWYFSGNAVGWCLSDFLFFYSIFPFLCRLITANKKLFIRIYWLILLVYAIVVIPLIPGDFVDGIIYISPVSRLLDFIFGILIWEYFIIERNVGFKGNPALHLLWAGGFFIVTILAWYFLPTRYNLSLLWWPSIAVLLLYAVTAGEKLLSIKPLVKFGDVSFSFYLIHVLAIRYLDIIFSRFNFNPSPFGRLLLILFLTIIASFVIHRYFVLPMEKLIRNRINSRNKLQFK